jgi:hypothetical protein
MFRQNGPMNVNAASINIRRATPNDARSIADIHVAAWRATYAGMIAQSYLDGLSVEERTTSWDRRLRNDSSSHSDIFVAESNDALLGFVSGGPHSGGSDNHSAQLHAVSQRPSATILRATRRTLRR